MPHHSRHEHDMMDRHHGDLDRGYGDHREHRDSSAFFRGSRDSDDRYRRSRDEGYRQHDRSGEMEGESRDRSFRPGRSSSRDRDWGSNDRDEHYGSDDFNRGIPMDETARLISSNKVEGTAVYDRHGDKLGTIHNFMVDKYSGEVKYAVLRHSSGFLGLGERYYPLEWRDLDYDTDKDGYRVSMSEDELRDMRSFGKDDDWRRKPQSRNHEHRGSSGREHESDRYRDGGRW